MVQPGVAIAIKQTLPPAARRLAAAKYSKGWFRGCD
jgi:hypothetical protein